jgi:hypothetical protein
MTASRREALRNYFLAVARDLIARGTLRRQQGQTLGDILKTEPRVVLAAVSEDLAIVGADLGIGFLGGLQTMLARADTPAAKIGSMLFGELLRTVVAKKR